MTSTDTSIIWPDGVAATVWPDGEDVGVWLRVSSGGQDEENQIPDVRTYCDQHRYNVRRIYKVHDKSAWKGEQQAAIDEMLHDMRTGVIKVLVVWHSDRLERRGPEQTFVDLWNIRDAGGRIESQQEPLFGQNVAGGAMMTAHTSEMNYQKSAHLSKQVGLAVARTRTNEALWGSLPTGYEYEPDGKKYNKGAVKTPDGERYVPQIFQKIADGVSGPKVAAWVRANTPWKTMAPNSIRRMIRNPAYRGYRVNLQGQFIGKIPPLVGPVLWMKANDRLDNSPRGRRTPASGESAFLTSALFCARCSDPPDVRVPMYRMNKTKPPTMAKEGAPARKRRDFEITYLYYRCRGRLPELKGCGFMVRLEIMDGAVRTALAQASAPWTELRFVGDKTYETELAEIELALAGLSRQGLSRQDEQAERERLWAEQDKYAALQEQASQRPKWADVEFCATCGPGKEYRAACETAEHHKLTVGEHFLSLDHDGQREMIVKDVKVYATPGTEPEHPDIHIESRLFKLPGAMVGRGSHGEAYSVSASVTYMEPSEHA